MKVNVNLELCCGSGLCTVNCPAVFELVEGKTVVKMDEVPPELQEMCEMAAFCCPTNAISIKD
jgi:ferredoxin